MDSSATSSFEVTCTPEQVRTAVKRVVAENGHTLGIDHEDGSFTSFRTKKSMLSWELDVAVTTTPTEHGSQVELHLDTKEGRAKALLDGKKNRRSADKLTAQIQAALAP